MTSDWETTTLAESGEWITGNTPRTSEDDYWGGDIPWLSASSLTTFRLRDSDRRLTSKGGDEGKVVPSGSVVFLVRGMSLQTEFRCGLAMREVAINQDCKAIVARDGLLPEYLAYALAGRADDVLGMVSSSGHGTGRLTTDRIGSLEVLVPPLQEQRAIAEVLSALDDEIELSQHVMETSRELLSVLVGGAPLSTSLDAVCRLEKRTLSAETLDGKEWLHHSIPAFDDGEHPVRERGEEIKSGKYEVPGGSVLFSKLNPDTPRVWLTGRAPDGAAISSTELLPLVPAEDVSLGFLYGALLADTFTDQMLQRVSGGTSSHQRVRPDDVLAAQVPDPSEMSDAQHGLLDDLADQVLASRRAVARSRRLRDTLLPKLVTGEVRVEDPEGLLEEAA